MRKVVLWDGKPGPGSAQTSLPVTALHTTWSLAERDLVFPSRQLASWKGPSRGAQIQSRCLESPGSLRRASSHRSKVGVGEGFQQRGCTKVSGWKGPHRFTHASMQVYDPPDQAKRPNTKLCVQDKSRIHLEPRHDTEALSQGPSLL